MQSAYKPELVSKLKQSSNYIDLLDYQSKELFFIENTQFIGEDKEKVYKTSEYKSYKSKLKTNLFYYPWLNTTVNVLEEEKYFKLITNRNKDLITYEEQKDFYNFPVAIFGMSVGSNIAHILTQAGISRDIVIADFDVLDTTNMNRIQAGVHQVGMHKCVIAARKITEFNPYSGIQSLLEGVTKDNLENLLSEKRIKLIVEEIDNFGMKIEVRKLAKKYKIPVIMVTDNGDWALMNIERYDLGYEDIFAKNEDYWKKRISECRSPRDFADIIINDVAGGEANIDPRMLMSLEHVYEKRYVSWPQLGSSAILGGVATTVAIKRIIRNEDLRPYVADKIII